MKEYAAENAEVDLLIHDDGSCTIRDAEDAYHYGRAVGYGSDKVTQLTSSYMKAREVAVKHMQEINSTTATAEAAPPAAPAAPTQPAAMPAPPPVTLAPTPQPPDGLAMSACSRSPSTTVAASGSLQQEDGRAWSPAPLEPLALPMLTQSSLTTAESPIEVTGLPSFHDIFALSIAVQSEVPAAVRQDFLQSLASLFRDTAQGASTAFRLLAMFPKCVLCSPKIGSLDSQLVKHRLLRWRAREYSTLWAEACAAVQKKKARPSDNEEVDEEDPKHKQKTQIGPSEKSLIRSAVTLVRQGEYSRAIARLQSSGGAPKDAETLAALLPLHPQSPPPTVEANTLLQAAELIAISEADVLQAVQSFNKLTSCGCLGLRVPLLKQMLRYDDSGTFLRALRTFVLACAHGKTPQELHPYLAGATLSAIPKASGGVRPIAAGEILRRIVAKAVLKQVSSRANKIFGDSQLGVGRKGGIENIVFSCSRAVAVNQSNPDFVGLKVDMKNAFNTLARDRMLLATQAFPELAHWLNTCYANHSTLWFGKFTLPSESGVQQGDPLGPLLFALTLMEAVHAIAQLHPALNKWYLDDGVIFGTHAQIQAALNILQGPALRDIGLHLNPSKCELIWLRPEYVRNNAFAPCFSNRVTDGNFIIVGSPIGSPTFQDATIRAVTAQAASTWRLLYKFEDVQAAYTLMRACCSWNRIAHLMRTVPPENGASAFLDFDKQLRNSFHLLTSITTNDFEWSQLILPPGRGGVGLRSAYYHSPAAFLAASCFYAADTGTSLNDIPGAIGATALFNSRIATPLNLNNPGQLTQKTLSGMLDTHTFNSMLAAADASSRARLILVSRRGAGEWLNVVPADHFGTLMTSTEFIVALQRWIGQPVSPDGHVCPVCGAQTCDTLGNHALQCTDGGSKTLRHHAIRDIFFKAAKSTGLRPELEPTNLCADGRRPADFLTKEGDNSICNDVFIIHPFAPAHSTATHSAPGSATDAYARRYKHTPFAKLPISRTHSLRALGADTFGGWNEEATEFITLLAKRESAKHNGCVHEATRCLYRRLNFAIIRHCTRAILYREETEKSHTTEIAVPTIEKSPFLDLPPPPAPVKSSLNHGPASLPNATVSAQGATLPTLSRHNAAPQHRSDDETRPQLAVPYLPTPTPTPPGLSMAEDKQTSSPALDPSNSFSSSSTSSFAPQASFENFNGKNKSKTVKLLLAGKRDYNTLDEASHLLRLAMDAPLELAEE